MKGPTVLAAALCALAVFFGWKTREAWIAPPPSFDNAARSASGSRAAGAPASDPAAHPDTAGAVAAVAARPLFRQDRQPPFAPDAGGPAGRNFEAELSRFALIGVLTFGEDLKGIVVTRGGGHSERYEVGRGDAIPGFKVKEVRIDGLDLTAEEKDFQLPLYAGAPAAGTQRTEVPRPAAAHAPGPAPAPVPAAQAPQAHPRAGAYAPGQAVPGQPRQRIQLAPRGFGRTFVPGSQ